MGLFRFRACGLGFIRVGGLGFRVYLGLGVYSGLGFKVYSGLGLRVEVEIHLKRVKSATRAVGIYGGCLGFIPLVERKSKIMGITVLVGST